MRWTTSVTMAAVLLLAGCGGGGGGGGTVEGPASAGTTPASSMSLPTVGLLTGVVTSDGSVSVSPSGPGIGDQDAVAPGVAYRQCFAFDLTGMPRDARVVSAFLKLYQDTVVGDPYGNHGVVVVDHVQMGSQLDARDFFTGNLTPSIAVLSEDASLGSKVADVTLAVEADLDGGRTQSQFRLRFSALESDGDGVDDYVRFASAGGAPVTTPVLEITWSAK